MTDATVCPGKDALRDFHLGFLPADEIEVVGGHLESCRACAAALAELESHPDHLLGALKETVARQLDPTAEPGTEVAPPSVPGYAVGPELGRGGMAVVYLARHERLDRQVALKVLHARGQGLPGGSDRLVREAKAVARLQHPGIVQVYDSGEHDGRLFLALEYCPGGTLADKLAGRPLAPAEAACRLAGLARAVHAAHEQGIVHRDLKPANVLVAADGALKVSDFGLAKYADDSDRLTRSGVVAGTPAYMAPEQAVGAAAVGAAADVWSLGVILYEMLTGRVPFLAHGLMQTLRQVSEADPVAPRRLHPQVPRDLETICLKCLEKAPAGRYPTAALLADDLDRFANGNTILARPAGPLARGWRWARRRPGTAALVAGLIVVTLAGAGGVTAALVYALEGWTAADSREKDAVTARGHEAEQRGRAERALYFSLIAQTELRWRANDAAAAAALLARCDPAHRGWEWDYLHHLLNAHVARADADTAGADWHPAAGWVRGVVFSADGTLLTAGGGNPFATRPEVNVPARLTAWDAATGKPIRVFESAPAELTALAVSADGRTAAALRWGGAVHRWAVADGSTLPVVETGPEGTGVLGFAGDTLFCLKVRNCPTGVAYELWDVTRGAVVKSGGREGGLYKSAAFSPDGRRAALGVGGGPDRGRVLVLDTATGDVTADLPLLEPPAGLAFDLAGKRLAVVADTVQVWDVAVGRPNWQAALPASGLCVGFGPGGKLLAVGLSDRSVRVWDGRTGSPGGVWRGHAGRVGCVAFAPDGKRLAAGTEQPGQWTVWNLARPQECLVAREYVDGGASPEGLGFAPGGRDLLLAAPARPLLRLDPVTGTRTPVTAGRMGFRAFSPAALFAVTSDGSRVAGPTDVPGEVKVWDAATGAEVTTLPTLGAFVQRVAVSRGGARVAAAGSRAEPDGRLVREVRVWDVATGAVLLARTSPADEPHPALALSADGQRVAAERPAGPRVLVVYDVTDGREIWAGGGHDDRIGGLAFDPAGGRLASGDGSGRVIVRDAATGHRLTADALSGPADVLAFAPDGKRLAGANRESVRVWEPETGQAVLDLGGVPSRASDDAFNPHLCWSADGRALAALRHRGHVVVWRAGP